MVEVSPPKQPEEEEKQEENDPSSSEHESSSSHAGPTRMNLRTKVRPLAKTIKSKVAPKKSDKKRQVKEG